MTRKIRFSKIYIIGLLITFGLFLLTGRTVYTHLTMNYTQDPTGDVYVTVYGEEEVLSEGMVEDGKIDLFFWGSEITGIAPIHASILQSIPGNASVNKAPHTASRTYSAAIPQPVKRNIRILFII